MATRLSDVSGEKFIAAFIVALQMGVQLPKSTVDQRLIVCDFLVQFFKLAERPPDALVEFITQIFLLHGKSVISSEKMDAAVWDQEQTISAMNHELRLLRKQVRTPSKVLGDFGDVTDGDVDAMLAEMYPDLHFEDWKRDAMARVDQTFREADGPTDKKKTP